MKIKKLKIRKIFSTTSKQTIEIELATEKVSARASVPFGTSAGKHEAKQLPVNKILKKFPFVRRKIVNKEFGSIEEIDYFLESIDGTNNFSNIGANLSLAISISALKAFAYEEGMEIYNYLNKKPKIPKPVCNIVGGWKGQSDIQEYLLIPKKQRDFFSSIETISKAYFETSKVLSKKDEKFKFGKNIESAWVCYLDKLQILDILSEVAKKYNLLLGLDVAASQFYLNGKYVYMDGKKLDKEEQIEFMKEIAEKYDLFYLEDPMNEDDFDGFKKLKKKLKKKLIVGDDLLVTNIERLKIALKNSSVNSSIVKPNQVGTFTKTKIFVEHCKKNKIVTIMSHRSSETDDNWLSHLAVGLGCEYIKLGISGERVIKINEMIRIEEKIKKLF